MKKCALLISTYNWPEALELCLKSVIQQSILPDEILIADDGSTDSTKELIESFVNLGIVNIKHVWHDDLGFRKTIILNKAISMVESEYIIQIDGDVILDRNFIKDHLFVREKGCFVRGTRAHISKDCVERLFKKKEISLKFYSRGVQNRFNALRASFLAFLMIRKKMSGKNVRGCNFAYWTQDVLDVNGYNNALTGWGHEDEELALRFVNFGLFKKSVKLRCVQYHIYHRLSSRGNEHEHDDELVRVQENKLVSCEFGIREISSY